MKLFLFAAVALFTSFTAAFAGDTELLAPPPGITLNQLFRMTNTRDTSVQSVNVMVNEEKFPAGIYVSPITWMSENTAQNTFWLRDIESPEGVVLVKSGNYDVLKLKGQLNRQTLEGKFQLSYLANGLTNKYVTCNFNLKKSGAGWYGQNAYNGQVIQSAHVVVYSLGIRNIEGICPNSFQFAY